MAALTLTAWLGMYTGFGLLAPNGVESYMDEVSEIAPVPNSSGSVIRSSSAGASSSVWVLYENSNRGPDRLPKKIEES